VRSQRARLNAELDTLEERKHGVLERAREQSEQELAALRQKVQHVLRELERARTERPAAAVAGLAQEAEALKPLRAPRQRRQRREPVAAGDLKVGQQVYVASLQAAGTIASAPDARGEVEVQMGSLRTRVNARDLARTDAREAAPAREPDITYRVDLSRTADISLQLDLRGMRAEAALEELDRYLHDAYLAGLKVVRIVHGKGTGALRQAVRQELATHAVVRHFETAEPNQGGEGATVVSLAN
jgi:DNA mismatch repair protein MutS2